MSKNPLQEKKELAKSMNKSTILTAVFILVAVVFAALVATGYRFGFETFYKKDLAPTYYSRTAVSFALMMFVYNLYKTSTIRLEKGKAEERSPDGLAITRYGKSKKLLGQLKDYLRGNHYENIIEAAADAENEKTRKEACQRLLNEVTYGLTLNDIEHMDEINETTGEKVFDLEAFIRKRKLRKREIKKLRKAISNALFSRVDYEMIYPHDILVDTSLDKKISTKQMTFNETAANIKENRKKAMMFLLSTAVTTALIWDGISWELVTNLLSQGMLIGSAVMSGLSAGYARINTLQLVTDNQTDFLNVALKTQLIQKPLEVYLREPVIPVPSENRNPTITDTTPFSQKGNVFYTAPNVPNSTPAQDPLSKITGLGTVKEPPIEKPPA